MTIDKAIKELTQDAEDNRYFHKNTLAKAEGLGIEALKRIASGRNPERRYVCYLLPGETKE